MHGKSPLSEHNIDLKGSHKVINFKGVWKGK